MTESGESLAPPELLYDALVATRAFIENPTPENRHRSEIATDKVRFAERIASMPEFEGGVLEVVPMFRRHTIAAIEAFLKDPTDRNKALAESEWQGYVQVITKQRSFAAIQGILYGTRYADKLRDQKLGQLLREWREVRGYTLAQVVEASIFHEWESDLSRLEQNTHYITIQELTILIIFYKLSKSEIDFLSEEFLTTVFSPVELSVWHELWINHLKQKEYLLAANWLLAAIRNREEAEDTIGTTVAIDAGKQYLAFPSEENLVFFEEMVSKVQPTINLTTRRNVRLSYPYKNRRPK